MIAEEKGLDLVEIASTANPPVCRIMNSGKFFYQQAKRDSEAKKHQRHIQVKEVKFRPKIDEHDFQFKKRNAERFLLDGNKVKSTVIFRGREMAHNEIGRRILNRLAVELTEVATVEVSPRQEGMTMVQILNPRKDLAEKAKAKAKADAKAEAKAEARAEARAEAKAEDVAGGSALKAEKPKKTRTPKTGETSAAAPEPSPESGE